MLVFALKILDNYLVAFRWIWYGDRYCFKFLSATSGPVTRTLGSRSQNFNVKDFALKFLGAHFFFTIWWIQFILAEVRDTYLKILSAASASMTMTLFLLWVWKFAFAQLSQSATSGELSCQVTGLVFFFVFFSTIYSEIVTSDYNLRGQFDGGGRPG